ncbi:hypothetical protein N0V93_004087 [Gnomoniopsis smithogilvyi]|uniref:ATP-grasp domain-containing protein n=1 Tax=Gnomoniopsis smithogilvyi TaxID=1191159 RepID=A0A9W8Z1P8_9PEZI|nr:hypothetical protein N0V93_004087 [Gnomoniopsis smithogilvyi]
MAPPVSLNPTLASLYSLDGGNSDEVALIYAVPHPTKLAKSLPVSVKYAYQAPRMANQSRPADIMALCCLGSNASVLRLRKQLLMEKIASSGVVAQYFAFVTGPMDLHLFDLDNAPTNRADAQRVYESIEESQRPRLHFVEEAEKFAALPQKKACVTPMDFLQGHEPLVDLDAHWDLLSKRSLALSDLPSPPTQVIDSKWVPGDAVSESGLEQEVARMLAPIEAHDLPFVVKMPHGLGSHAVFMVRNEERRAMCLQVLGDELPSMLQTWTLTGDSKTPPSLLLQELVSGPSLGISVFITKKGGPIFISCVDQVLGDDDCWAGGLVDYTQQEALGAHYRETIERVAAYVYARGYWGPMGVDVMTDETGQQLIIDMNIRHTGDLTLGMMKHHFWEKNDLPLAWLDPCVFVRGNRDQFEETFRDDLESGGLVITGWSHVPNAGSEGGDSYSFCALLAGAKDKERLQQIIDRVALQRVT